MRKLIIGAAIALPTLALTGCGGDGTPGGGGDARALAATCTDATNMSQALCDCIAETAETELTTEQLSFLVASMSEDETAAEMARGELSITDAIEVASFMTSAPANCAAALPPEEDVVTDPE